jgi:hypothetical protein
MLNFSSFFDQGLHSTLRVKPGKNWSYKGQWIQIYLGLDVEIDRWYVGDFSSVSYQISVEYDSYTKETINLLVVATPNSVNIVDYGRIGTVSRLAEFSVDVTDSYVSLRANPSSVIYDGTRVIFSANYAESISNPYAAAIPKTIQESKFYSEYGFETTGFTAANGIINVDRVNADELQVGSSLSVLNNIVSITSSGSTGSINNVVIGNITPRNGSFTNLNSSILSSLNDVDVVGDITANANDSVINFSPTGTGSVTINPSTVGSINNMTIGSTVPRSAVFTTINSTSLSSTTGTVVTLNSTTGTITTLNSTTGNITTGNITTINATTITATNVTINNNLTVDTITADEVTLNNAPSSPNKATRKDYVDATAAALAIALGG